VMSFGEIERNMSTFDDSPKSNGLNKDRVFDVDGEPSYSDRQVQIDFLFFCIGLSVKTFTESVLVKLKEEGLIDD